MSRSGYYEDIDQWDLIRWRGAVNSAMNGVRGQEFLLDLLASLDALPEKKLIRGDLIKGGSVCAIGAVGLRRGLSNLPHIDPHDPESVANAFGIAPAMAREIVYANDELNSARTPEERFTRMREWVVSHIKAVPA